MKHKLYFFLLLVITTFTIVKCSTQSPNEQEELRKFASQLIEALDPEAKMTEQEKSQLVDKTVQETIQMDNYLKSLPESERLAEEKKIEDAVSYLMSEESPIKDMFDPNQKQQPTEDSPVTGEVVQEKEEEVTIEINKDIKDLKNLIETITQRISSLLIKVKSMPRISEDKTVEKQWINLKSSLTLIESILKIVIKKDNLLSLLQENTNKILKTNLSSLKSNLQKEIKFTVPDTAGLTISFDEEEDSDNIEFISAQKNLKNIIDSLDKLFKDTDLMNQLISFIKTNAAGELQKNPEINKQINEYKGSPNNTSSYIPRTSDGYRPSSGYYPPSSGFSGFDFPLPPDSYNPSLSTGPQNVTPENKAQKATGSGRGSKGSKDHKGKKPEKTERYEDKTANKKKAKKEKEDKKNVNPALEKYIQDLKESLSDLSKSYKSANIPSLQEEIKSEEDVPQKRSISATLMNIRRSYDKANKIAYNFKAAMKLHKQNREYNKEAKNIYHKSKIDEEFKVFNEFKESFGKTGFPEASAKLNEELNELQKNHKNLIEVLEIDKCDIKDDYKDLHESIDNINNSIEQLSNKVDQNLFDDLFVAYKSASKSLNCIKQHVEKDKTQEKEFKNIKDALMKNLKASQNKLDSMKMQNFEESKKNQETALQYHKYLLDSIS